MKRTTLIMMALLVATTAPAGGAQAEGSASSQAVEQQRVRDEVRAAGLEDPGRDPRVFNDLGYRALYQEGDNQKALRFMRWNVVLFPQYASMAYDSLGEAYLQTGERELAIQAYQSGIAAATDPQNVAHSRSILQRLTSEAEAMRALQAELREAFGRGTP